MITERRSNTVSLGCATAMWFAGSAFFAQATHSGPITAQPPVGAPLDDLTPGELDRFLVGQVAFARDLEEIDGLGPIFNQTACGDCHLNPLGATGTQAVVRAGLLTKGGFDPLEEIGGSLFQLFAISEECAEDIPKGPDIIQTERITNGMTGYGLVEAIDDCDILAVRDAQDLSIQGNAHLVGAFEANPVGDPCSPETLRVGRFGWKAQVPTLLTFSADASLNEMGLTNRFLPNENDPNGINPPSLLDCDAVDDPEDSVAMGNGVDREFIDVVTDFQRFMTQPPQTPKSGMAGEPIFNAIGCAACHHKTYTTSNDVSLETAIRNKVINPYSDFLLHDMGLNGDGIPQGAATGGELKTPPLWGLKQRPATWHDGRFASGGFAVMATDAIAEHDALFSQGSDAAQAFDLLSAPDKASVIAFLGSLGQREFDANDDDQVTLLDFANNFDPETFRSCYLSTPGPDDPCAIHDVDQAADVDQATDFATFLTVYSGQLSDCDQNGVLDLIDILDGATDADDNGVLDACEPTCLGDLDGDGVVGIVEFTQVLDDWGPCPALPAPCESDYDRDGMVGIVDFLLALSKWGPCI